MAQLATLSEVKRKWTLCDLADAHELLDLQDECERARNKPK